MGGTDRWDCDYIETELAWQERERAIERARERIIACGRCGYILRVCEEGDTRLELASDHVCA